MDIRILKRLRRKARWLYGVVYEEDYFGDLRYTIALKTELIKPDTKRSVFVEHANSFDSAYEKLKDMRRNYIVDTAYEMKRKKQIAELNKKLRYL